MKTTKKIITDSFLYTLALLVLGAGAVSSLGFMFYTGRHNSSFLLMALFTVWVLSPFVALMVGHILSRRWPIRIRTRIIILIVVITFGSLVGYSGMWSPEGTKPAFMFLVIPLMSWSLIGVMILMSRRFLNSRNPK